MRLPSLKTDIQHLLCQLVDKTCSQGITNDATYCLSLLLHQGAVIDPYIIHRGVGHSGYKYLEWISSNGVNLKQEGALALSTAARLNNYEAVTWMLEDGVDINSEVVTNQGLLSIIVMAAGGDIARMGFAAHYFCQEFIRSADGGMLRYLISRGAKLSIRSYEDDLSSFMLLKWAIWHDSSADDQLQSRIELVRDLVDPRKINWSLICHQMHHTGSRGCQFFEAFKLLFRPDSLSESSSFLAALIAHGGGDELIHQALEAGADINGYSQAHGYSPGCWYYLHMTPIQAAAYRGDHGMVSYLLQRGANIHQAAHKNGGITALQAACAWPALTMTDRERKTSLIRLIIAHGVDIDEPPPNRHGFTALGFVAELREVDNAVILVSRGTDYNMRACNPLRSSEWGQNPLDIAAGAGRLDMVKFLLNAGAFSFHRGSTEYDGAIELAQEGGYFTISDLIRRKAMGDLWLLGRNPHL